MIQFYLKALKRLRCGTVKSPVMISTREIRSNAVSCSFYFRLFFNQTQTLVMVMVFFHYGFSLQNKVCVSEVIGIRWEIFGAFRRIREKLEDGVLYSSLGSFCSTLTVSTRSYLRPKSSHCCISG